ncbi:hypothetical protein DPMN_074841 [Dreissena polymorpha]|uniref:Secreted protein n=1 Tax=Dreissena polymorpha TaxID=45954 RepID=A0A9D3YJD5_DREPO|nr:hypothetical protein DPMN_074841 [Dreissena polymorpha]
MYLFVMLESLLTLFLNDADDDDTGEHIGLTTPTILKSSAASQVPFYHLRLAQLHHYEHYLPFLSSLVLPLFCFR